MEEYRYWQKENRKMTSRINELIRDIEPMETRVSGNRKR
ncbi:type II toxin-antitoxin system YoeB family toxin [Syntrophomonas wolfei]